MEGLVASSQSRVKAEGMGGRATHQRQRSLVQDLLPGLPNKLQRAGEDDGGDLTLDVLRTDGDDVCLDMQGTEGDVLAQLSETAEVFSVYGQLVDRDVISSLGRVRPPEDGIASSVKDVLGVGTDEVGSEGNVEGVVDDRVADLRRCYGRNAGLGIDLVVLRMESLHDTEIGPRAKGWTHSL